MKPLIALIVMSASAWVLATPLAQAAPSDEQQTKVENAAPSGMTEKQRQDMQARMKAMQQQMDRLHRTTDPKERQKLMHEHMQAMQAQMQAMRTMGGGMMSGTMGHGMGQMQNLPPAECARMMQDRMDMMQMMMEHMMGQMQMQSPDK